MWFVKTLGLRTDSNHHQVSKLWCNELLLQNGMKLFTNSHFHLHQIFLQFLDFIPWICQENLVWKYPSPSEWISPYCRQIRHRRADRGTELCKGSLIIMRINFLSSTLPLCFLVVAYLFVSELTKTTMPMFLFKITKGSLSYQLCVKYCSQFSFDSEMYT